MTASVAVGTLTPYGSGRLLEYEKRSEVPSVGTMLYVGTWSESDEPVEITPPDPGSVVELDAPEDELGQLPLPGGGLVA
ncbi:hypothetical protein ACL02R_01900 [Streptomyces sp. MS19]|uniref:hypothetical protein n=1 Tax=Streptomyces sp. MS19 TaxID=3385972 RepID=UPI0039A2499A